MKAEPFSVSDVLTLQRRPASIHFDQTYVEIGIRSFGRGLFHKDPVSGEAIGNKNVFYVKEGDLIFSNVFAWEGAVAIAAEAEDGLIGSHRFMTYKVNDRLADTKYLFYYFTGGGGLLAIRKASPGSAGRNRTLGIQSFAAQQICLPGLTEQRRIAARLDVLLGSASMLDLRAASDEIAAISTRGISQIMRRFAAGTVKVHRVCRLVGDTVHPGDDPAPAKEFIGLEHIRPHLGVALGSREIGGEKGRKFRFASGDILYGYLRPYLNKVWLADRPGLCSVEQYVLRPSGSIPAELLAHGLRSAETLDKVIALTHNLQLPRLRSGLLLDLELPWIPEEAHADAIQALRQFDMKILRLTELKSAQKSGFAALRPALLNAAFSGEL